ncbi:calcium uniporter protein, mitochondrial [Anthonomus grandis grandis]|uniref:calcium uniporter protein, mitochondrial n=1 Tax=Anthonomus grandis grandis TaxID=2921223 RepID=UPI0021650400|nr:calcium uniporter protein, mitochondrial [Anthonomus grandis grandis]
MAIPRVLCRARFLLNSDIFGINKFTPLINSASLNKIVHVQVVRSFRTNFSVNLVTTEKKEKDKNKELTSSTSSSSSSSSDSDHTDDDSDSEGEVIVEIHRGLPRITVPLPSRKENCSFTVKPISNTVGDFIEMLKKEDKGIDRVVCKTKEGTRIASSNTIETLLEDDFKLVINDCTYNVNTPKDERLTQEEVQSLHDIKCLVHKLYEQLNVQEHQLSKERELVMELEALKQEVQPLEQARNEIEVVAHKRSNWLAWAGLGLMSVQFGILARLTWWEYSWDIMEPVTYFVTYGTAMAAYAYFVLTKEEYVLTDVRDRQHLLIMHKKAKKVGVDLTKYNQLKEQIHKVEYKLKKLRNPLKLHLPKNGKTVAAAPITEAIATTPEAAAQTETSKMKNGKTGAEATTTHAITPDATIQTETRTETSKTTAKEGVKVTE